MASLNEGSGEEATSESNVMQTAAKDVCGDSMASRPRLLQERSTNGLKDNKAAKLSVLQSYEHCTEAIDEEIEEMALD